MLTNLHFKLRGFIENLFIRLTWLQSNIYCFRFTVDPTRTARIQFQDNDFTYSSFSISKLNWIYAIMVNDMFHT